MLPSYSTAPWGKRRRLIYLILLFCAGVVVYVLSRELDLRIYETALLSAFALAGATIGSYVFGAAYDDASARDANARIRGAADPSQTPPDDFPGGQ